MTDGPATSRIRIWDPWIRVAHWGIAVLLVLCVVSGLRGDFDTHFRVGYALLALAMFRIAWGFVGSDTARFAGFLKGPRAALHHLAEFRARAPETTPGHNAAGGWAVVLLLLLLLAQAGTGLMASDAIFTFGPLARVVSPDVSDAATSLHIRAWIVLLAVVVNAVELMCSAGVPAVFTHLLAGAGLSTPAHLGYLLLYVLVFMLDDLAVLAIALKTLELTGLAGTHARWARLLGAVLLFAIAAVLFLRPGWLGVG